MRAREEVLDELDDGEAACPAAPLTEYLFASLERSLATNPALAPVKAARGRGDNEAACRLLSAYYDTSPAGASFRLAAARRTRLSTTRTTSMARLPASREMSLATAAAAGWIGLIGARSTMRRSDS